MKISYFAFFILLSFSLYSQERKDLSITIYNTDLGVVKEKRILDIKSGVSEIRIVDIPERIDPTSVLVKFEGKVLEQNYQYDLISIYKILDKYIDKQINLSDKDNNISGKLLSVENSQIVLQTNEGNLLMLSDINKYKIMVKDLPTGLITKPTLVWKIDAKKSGKQEFEITYSVGNINWHTEYVALLNENDTKMDLNSWVSIENKSGGAYPETEMKLIAGDVNRVRDVRNFPVYDRMEMAASAKGVRQDDFEEKSLFEYHIYNLQRKTNINNNETKQISLFNSENISVDKKFKYYTSFYNNIQNGKVGVYVEFKNSEKNNLGIPMPKGKIRVFKSTGNSKEFIGEDMLNHTPKEEIIKVKLGDAFDVLIDEALEDQKQISKKVTETESSLTIKNRKDEQIEVEIEANTGWGNWEIINSNFKYEKKNANTIVFKIPVNKNSEEKLKVKIRNSYY